VLTLFTILVTYLYMERFSEWLGSIGRHPRRSSDIPTDHALVPAGNRSRSAAIRENAAE
jgi:hypothetical protein